MKMSSMNLFQRAGFQGICVYIFFPKCCHNKLAYEGANLVPIAVPESW